MRNLETKLSSVPTSTLALLLSAALVLAAGAIVGNTLNGTVNVTDHALTISLVPASDNPLWANGTVANALTGAHYNVTVRVFNAAAGRVNFVLNWSFTSTGTVAPSDIQLEDNTTGTGVPFAGVVGSSLLFQTIPYTISPRSSLDYSYDLVFVSVHTWTWSIAPYAQ